MSEEQLNHAFVPFHYSVIVVDYLVMDYSPTLMSAHTLPTGFPQRRAAAFQLHDLFDPDSKHLGDLRASITLSRGQQFIRSNSPCVRRDKYIEDLIRSSAKAGIKLMNSYKPRWAPRQKSATVEMWNLTRRYFDGLAGSSWRNTADIRSHSDGMMRRIGKQWSWGIPGRSGRLLTMQGRRDGRKILVVLKLRLLGPWNLQVAQGKTKTKNKKRKRFKWHFNGVRTSGEQWGSIRSGSKILTITDSWSSAF